MSQVTITDVKNVETLLDGELDYWIETQKKELLYYSNDKYAEAVLDDYVKLVMEKERRK